MIARGIASDLLVATILALAVGPLSAQQSKADAHGDSLPAGAVSRLGTVRWRAANNIVLATMLDSRTALTVTEDHLVQIWDTASGKELRRIDCSVAAGSLPGGTTIRVVLPPSLRFVTVSRDGKRLVNLGQDRAIHVWDLQTGTEVAKLANAAVFSRNTSLSADGGMLAAMSIRGGRSPHG